MAESNATSDDVGTLLEAYKEEIVVELNRHTIGLDYTQHFMPIGSRRKLVTYQRLCSLFPSLQESQVRWLVDHASNTFLITLLCLTNYDDLTDAFAGFYHCGFGDNCLPTWDTTGFDAPERCTCNHAQEADKPSNYNTSSDSRSSQEAPQCNYHITREAFSRPYWNTLRRRQFFNEQWSFIPQQFDSSVFEYNLESQRLLPFIVNPQDIKRTGGFAEVIRARIPREYLLGSKWLSNPREFGAKENDFIEVAIKTLRPKDESYYNIEQEWRKEIQAHRALTVLNHGHHNIVAVIAAFRQANKYHILFEWAAGGTLREFWARNPKPHVTASLVLDIVEQMAGLANALKFMHNGGDIRDPTWTATSLSLTRDEIDRAVMIDVPRIVVEQTVDDLSFSRQSSRDTGENWRHGDIKPDNILIFPSEPAPLGTLKLADLGRAKHHTLDTRSRPEIEWEYWGTTKYEPPDLSAGKPERSMSRLYDVWSLGCVFFECLVWLLYGSEGLNKHDEQTGIRESMGTPFWNRVGSREATISQTTSLLMNVMQDHAAFQGDSALGDVLKLIRTKMLVVSLPTDSDQPVEGRRCNADVVSSELKRIVDRAHGDPFYLSHDTNLIEESTVCTAGTNDTTSGDQAELVSKPPAMTEPRTPLAQRRRVTRPILRKSKSYAGPVARVGLVSVMEETIPLRMPKLNQITLAKSNITTQFTHSLHDTWHYEDDSVFACQTLCAVRDQGIPVDEFHPNPHTKLCDACAGFDPASPSSFGNRSLSSLRRLSATCSLCEYLFRLADKAGLLATHKISLTRDGGLMKINNTNDMRMRICRPFNSKCAIDDHRNGIPTGLPRLQRTANLVHPEIIRQWLFDCDISHGSCAPSLPLAYCPKRLLYLGMDDECRLVETRSLGLKRGYLRYVALSHPWGIPQEHEHFKSTKSNRTTHLAAIDIEQLPANYQDAVRVCRAAGAEWLWIDSLCILQPEEDDPGDFHEEAAFFQDVFNCAYFVIAASSAQGTSSGFLKPKKPSELIALPGKPQGRQIEDTYYISDVLDDFENDVLDGPLNDRGWVMQELATARRTMFFASNQTYFQCGQGVRCETLSKLRWYPLVCSKPLE